MAGIPEAYDPPNIQRFILNKPARIHPMRWSQRLSVIIAIMVDFYKTKAFDEDGHCQAPFIVFCVSKALALAIGTLLARVADEMPLSDEKKNRIRIVTGDNQFDKWQSDFLQNPNQFALDADVLIITNVLQAGHSIECHFRTCFDLLNNKTLTHREEVQFIGRWRILGREDLLTHRYAWIQPGRTNKCETSHKVLTKTLNKLVDERGDTDQLSRVSAVTEADLLAERADSFNRHAFLWISQYIKANVSLNVIRTVSKEADMPAQAEMKPFEHWINLEHLTIDNKKALKMLRDVNATLNKSILAQLPLPDYDPNADPEAELRAEENLINVIEVRGYMDFRMSYEKEISRKAHELRMHVQFRPAGDGIARLSVLLARAKIDTSKSIAPLLSPFYALSAYLDYCLFMQGYPADQASWWTHRANGINTGIQQRHRIYNVMVAYAVAMNFFGSPFPNKISVFTASNESIADLLERRAVTTDTNQLDPRYRGNPTIAVQPGLMLAECGVLIDKYYLATKSQRGVLRRPTEKPHLKAIMEAVGWTYNNEKKKSNKRGPNGKKMPTINLELKHAGLKLAILKAILPAAHFNAYSYLANFEDILAEAVVEWENAMIVPVSESEDDTARD